MDIVRKTGTAGTTGAKLQLSVGLHLYFCIQYYLQSKKENILLEINNIHK